MSGILELTSSELDHISHSIDHPCLHLKFQIQESRALCIKLAQLKRELHIGKQQVPMSWSVLQLVVCRVASTVCRVASRVCRVASMSEPKKKVKHFQVLNIDDLKREAWAAGIHGSWL